MVKSRLDPSTLIGLTYSSISKIVSSVNDRIQDEKKLKAQFDVLNSQFKV